ncbi:N-acetylglucosamine-6-phosphate deacetylase [Pediococcus acidilactici]|nr:N-acetylglucosamine-6-phosphate deacetylase [Pediococcus acidilactici]
MSTVLRHATIYTGLEKIEDGYIRFGKTIEAVGPMSEYKAQGDDEVYYAGARLLFQGSLTYIPTVVTVLMRWMAIQNKSTKW